MKNREVPIYVPSRLLRLPQVLEILPVSKSHFLAGVKEGFYPSPVKLSKRIICWKEESIKALVDNLEEKS